MARLLIARGIAERAVVKAVITDTRLITVRIPVNNRTSYDYTYNLCLLIMFGAQ